jgi:tetratricopeptide (TPR) repeat protein
MKESYLKYIFWSLLILVLAFILITSKYAGITCDEVLHYNQSKDVWNYFATGGEDKSALSNPVWHLSYYGQSYDNIVTFIAQWLKIEDIYSFRHIMSSVAGWLVIVVTALFSVWISGYRTGIFAVLLFAVTPLFTGHSHNNLKDIPFALGYIASLFFTLKFLKQENKNSIILILLLMLSIAFTISIRAAGAVVIFYLGLFFLVHYAIRYLRKEPVNSKELINRFLLVLLVSVSGYFLSIVLWPYALQDPIHNVIRAYKVMAHYPDTFRQIFEGKVEWSDFMPWYYLPKSMLITIPLAVSAGLLLFVFLARRWSAGNKSAEYFFIIFTVFFPLLFAIAQKSNVYSSWRQFLFIYPALVLLSAKGFDLLYEQITRPAIKYILIAAVLLLAVHPVKFMISNPGYYYMYYNQIVGGLKGAYGNYETDYYFLSQTEASEWLTDYIESKGDTGKIKVAATFSVAWQFRKNPDVETSFIRFDERNQSDWDYAIINSRYVGPWKLKNKIWPDTDAIHIIYVEGVPVCEVLKRKSKDDLNGYQALEKGDYTAAAEFFSKALTTEHNDEMIFYNFATALQRKGEKARADSLLRLSLGVNPDFEEALMFLGNIAVADGRKKEAEDYYKRVLSVNRKYFEAYPLLADLYKYTDIKRSRNLLRSCLEINPHYKPAIKALADSYRKSDPDIAEKYDKLADSVK